MRTPLDCLPCFMKQAVTGARMAAPTDEDLQTRIVTAFGAVLNDFDFALPPPALAGCLYGLIRDMSGCGPDLFKEHKRVSNEQVMELLPRLRRAVNEADDPFEAALHLSIVGNYIDVGVQTDFDWESEAGNPSEPLPEDVYARFLDRAREGAEVLILGDNAGEIGLDTVLVEKLNERGCSVTYTVRSGPVLNDALMEDARTVGMAALCDVVESGVRTPGTIVSGCTDIFLQRMKDADVILSKGQGNYEALWNEWDGVFFAFKAKCPVVGTLTGLPVGSSVFTDGR